MSCSAEAKQLVALFKVLACHHFDIHALSFTVYPAEGHEELRSIAVSAAREASYALDGSQIHHGSSVKRKTTVQMLSCVSLGEGRDTWRKPT